jgi:hypothetical protein
MASTISSKEGSWAKMILLGFISPQLAGEEAIKLGFGNKTQAAMDANGNTGMIEYNAKGEPLKGIKADGSAMTQPELIQYAAQGVGKASDVSMTPHQAVVNGELHTFESKRTAAGTLYRDATANGGWSRQAPQGLTNIGQQDPAHLKGLAAAKQVATQMRTDNAKAAAVGGQPLHSEAQIQIASNAAYQGMTGKPLLGNIAQPETPATAPGTPAATAPGTPASNAPAPTAPAPTAPAPTAPVAAKTKSMAQQVLDYEIAPPTGPTTPAKIALQNEVNRLAGEQGKTYNGGNFKIVSTFNNSASGKALKSINVAVDHLDTLQEAANELKNGPTPAFNKIVQMYASNTGGTAPGNFDALKSIVGSEVAKAVTGGASALGDREEIRKEINNSKTPEQLAGVIGKYQALMAGQAKGIRQEWVSNGLDEKRFDDKLMPRTKVVLNQQKQPSRSNW